MNLSIARIERGAYRTWSPDETAEIGGWTVGSNGGFTRRANSANTRGSADTSLRIEGEIRTWLEDRGGHMAVRITPLVPSEVEAAVAQTWHLHPADPTPVLVRTLDQGVFAPDDVERVDPREPAFADLLLSLNRRPASSAPVWARLIDRLEGPHAGLRIGDSAVGFVAVEDGIAFVYSVAVAGEHRRSGLATRIMDAAHAFGVEHGAEASALQVLGTNEPALALYSGLGYRERYRYHYLQDPPSRRP